MTKIEKRILAPLWFFIIPTALAIFVILIVLWEFDYLTPNMPEQALIAILYSMLVVAVVFLAGFFINTVWSFVGFIQEKIRFRYLDKHPEKCVTNEQLAEDFEKLAKALRESEEEK